MSRESLIVGRDLPSPSLVEGHAPAAVEVARRAEAASAHLARVAASADVAQVYGALVDLFIATPPELMETRAAALERYERALSQAEHQALADAVVTGLETTSVIPPCPCSMFSAGVTQGAPLVLRPEPAPEPEPVAEPDAPSAALELVPEAGPEPMVSAPPMAELAPSPAVTALAPVPTRPRLSVGSVLAGLGAVAVVLRALRRRRQRG